MVNVMFLALVISNVLLNYATCECNDSLDDCFYSNRQNTHYDCKLNSIRQKNEAVSLNPRLRVANNSASNYRKN